MRNKWLFLRWTLLTMLIAVSAFILARLGAFEFISRNDGSYITFIILTIFVIVACWCGYLTWRGNQAIENNDESQFAPTIIDAKWIIVLAQVCTALGMIGTVLGILMAFYGSGGEFKGTDNKAQLGVAVGTAYITTLAGLVCAVLLTIYYFNLVIPLKQAQFKARRRE